MVADLEQHLAGMSWTIKTFRVHEDYIYLLVEAPAEPPPHEVIHDLMRRSAEIARSKDRAIDPDALWDDSSWWSGARTGIEVQQYINFVRDR
jgi:REP element-mobilizing transposase RayT